MLKNGVEVLILIENILLNDTKDLSSIKICDFGLSAQYNDATCTRSFNEKCGTDIYMAPELWKKKRYSKVFIIKKHRKSNE